MASDDSVRVTDSALISAVVQSYPRPSILCTSDTRKLLCVMHIFLMSYKTSPTTMRRDAGYGTMVSSWSNSRRASGSQGAGHCKSSLPLLLSSPSPTAGTAGFVSEKRSPSRVISLGALASTPPSSEARGCGNVVFKK